MAGFLMSVLLGRAFRTATIIIGFSDNLFRSAQREWHIFRRECFDFLDHAGSLALISPNLDNDWITELNGLIFRRIVVTIAPIKRYAAIDDFAGLTLVASRVLAFIFLDCFMLNPKEVEQLVPVVRVGNCCLCSLMCSGQNSGQ
jgi:hypothetical protein